MRNLLPFLVKDIYSTGTGNLYFHRAPADMDTFQLYHEFLNLMESCDYEVQEVHEPEGHRLDHGQGVHGIYDVYGESEKIERSIQFHSLVYSSPNKSCYTSSQPSPHESFDISLQPRQRQLSRIDSQTNLQSSRPSNSSISSISSNSQSLNLQSSTSQSSTSQSSTSQSSTSQSSTSQTSKISNVVTKPIQSPKPLHRPYRNITLFSASNLTGYPNLGLSPCQTYLNSSYLKSPLNSPCNSCLNTSLIELTGLVNDETDIIDDDDLYYSGDSDSDFNAVIPGLFPSMDIERDFLTFEELPMNPSYVC